MKITGKPRILLIDDDMDLADFILSDLTDEGYQVKHASNGRVGLDEIDDFDPHLIILDIHMPELDGFQTLKELRKRDEYVSVILVSGEVSSESVTAGLDQGADDFLKKPFQMRELLARIRCQLRIKALRDELKESNVKLKYMVNIDDLTGLLNMRSVFDRFDQELERAKRQGQSIAVMMVDMDHFKEVNDKAGHVFGSKVLKRMGEIFRENVRLTDVAARYGGDEFLLVLNSMDEVAAEAFGEKLIQRIKQDAFQTNPYGVKVAVSIGCTVVHPTDNSVSKEEILRLADKALYVAKANGRNCFYMRDSTDPVLQSKKLNLQGDNPGSNFLG